MIETLRSDAEVGDRVRVLARDVVTRSLDATGALPTVGHDPAWPSVCIASEPLAGRCRWQPQPMAPPADLSGLARALDVTLHPDWTSLFCTQWAASLPLVYHGEHFELLQLWNDQDREHLIANQIGHALEKRRIRQPLSLFFGLVDDDRLLTVENETGRVLVETLGTFEPHELTPTVIAFLHQCRAAAPEESRD